jgi:hypothetical protein
MEAARKYPESEIKKPLLQGMQQGVKVRIEN